MRAGFRDQLTRNKWKLRFLLLFVFALTAVAGHTLGRAFERTAGPAEYYDEYAPRPPWYRDYPNQVAAALVLLVFVQYLRVRRRGDTTVLAFVGATRLQDQRLRNVTQEMALAAGIRTPRLHVVEDESLNAFACGAGDRHAIVVTRGLLRRLERAELQAVLAHETAHIRNGDTKLMTVLFGMSRVLSMTAAFAFGPLVALVKSRGEPAWITKQRDRLHARVKRANFSKRQKVLFLMVAPLAGVLVAAIGCVLSLLLLLLFSTFLRFLPWIAVALAAWEGWKLAGEEGPPSREKPRRWSTLLLFAPVGLVVGPAILLLGAVFPFVFLLLRLAVSRNQEFAADASAVDLTRNPDALVGALRELREDTAKATRMRPALSPLAIARVGSRAAPAWKFLRRLRTLFSTHPPLDERIERLVAMGAHPPPERVEAVRLVEV